MAKSVISPFSGRPRTLRATDKNGDPVFRVSPCELTPARAMAADGFSTVTCLGAVAEGVLYLQSLNVVPGHYWAVAIAGPFAVYPFFKGLVRALLRKRLRFEVTRDEFRVRKWFGWKTFSRQYGHRFLLAPHRLARKEQQAHQRQIQSAARRGKTITKRPYFAESYHLIFEYVGQPHEIGTFLERERAMAVQMRLRACDEKLNQELGNKDGIALDPEEQWTRQPGDIPETN